jgi:hypothetical protein
MERCICASHEDGEHRAVGEWKAHRGATLEKTGWPVKKKKATRVTMQPSSQQSSRGKAFLSDSVRRCCRNGCRRGRRGRSREAWASSPGLSIRMIAQLYMGPSFQTGALGRSIDSNGSGGAHRHPRQKATLSRCRLQFCRFGLHL